MQIANGIPGDKQGYGCHFVCFLWNWYAPRENKIPLFLHSPPLPIQSEEEHTTHLAALKQEKDILTETMAQRDQQMAALEAELQQLKATLGKEKEYSSKTIQELQNRLGETVSWL